MRSLRNRQTCRAKQRFTARQVQKDTQTETHRSRNTPLGDTWQEVGGSKLPLGCSLMAALCGTCLAAPGYGGPSGKLASFPWLLPLPFLFHHRHQGVMQ